jgi:hypothetical protein
MPNRFIQRLGLRMSVETGLLTDDIANGSSNAYAVGWRHMLAGTLIVG